MPRARRLSDKTRSHLADKLLDATLRGLLSQVNSNKCEACGASKLRASAWSNIITLLVKCGFKVAPTEDKTKSTKKPKDALQDILDNLPKASAEPLAPLVYNTDHHEDPASSSKPLHK